MRLGSGLDEFDSQQTQNFLSSPNVHTFPGDHPTSYSMEIHGSYTWKYSGQGAKMTNQLLLRLRMNEAILHGMHRSKSTAFRILKVYDPFRVAC